ARAEVADPQAADAGPRADRLGDLYEPRGEEADVEAQVRRACVARRLLRSEEVDQEGREPAVAQRARHGAVARAEAARAAPVREDHDAAGGRSGAGEVSGEGGAARVDRHLARETARPGVRHGSLPGS